MKPIGYLLHLIIVSLFASLLTGQTVDSEVDIFDQSVIHEIKISFDHKNAREKLTRLYEENRKLRYKAASNNYLKCNVTIDGDTINDIGVRYKGASSYSATSSNKKSLKLNFSKYIEGQNFQGLKKINLQNGIGDPSFQRELLSNELLKRADAPYCRTSYAKVYIDNKYAGLYLILEQIDKPYLKRHFGTKKGNLYKVISGQSLSTIDNEIFFKKFFQLRTNKEEGNYSRIFEFVELINSNYEEDFQQKLEGIFDVSTFLKVLAIYTLTNNWDSYLGTCRNYYLYHNTESNKISWLAWDLNLSFGGTLKDYNSDEYQEYCKVNSRFKVIMHENLEYEFSNKSSANAQEYFWDFGDGQTSTEIEPRHSYKQEGRYEICLTTKANYFSNECTSTRCDSIRTPSILASCPCFENEWAPYPAEDINMQKAISYYYDMCDKKWTTNHQETYDYFKLEEYKKPRLPKLRERNFSLLHKENNKILVKRILSIPEYESEYLTIVQQLLEDFFNPEALSQYINDNMDRIRQTIKEDPQYLYPQEIVDLDLTDGKDADPHDPERVKLIGINNFIEQKYQRLLEELDQIKIEKK